MYLHLEDALVEKAKQVTWRLLAAGVCLLTVSSVARADSLDEQRSRYAQIKQAWDNIPEDVKTKTNAELMSRQ